jgi:aryl-alcohol dehydrogenase-like predicted oxidoreductase
MDEFVARGGSFIDTAHVYGDWGPGEKAKSEKVIGAWMTSRGCRRAVRISTKGGHPRLDTMDVPRLSAKELEVDLGESLDALRTDTIDLYFLHRDDPHVPVAELIEWLESQKARGSIRHYGCSNWSLQRIVEAQQYARSKGYAGFICNQIQDSLADVNRALLDSMQMVVADEFFDAYHRQSGMNLMAYMALAHGYFAKREANVPLSERQKELYDLPQNVKMLEVMKGMQPYSVNDFSYQYILQRPYPAIPITSFSTIEQMREAIASCSTAMPVEMIEKVSAYKR